MLLLTAASICAAQDSSSITRLTTSTGIPFAIVGEKKPAPSPLLVIFAGSIEQTLNPKYYPLGTRLREERGFLLVTLDLPGHGADHRPGEPASLAAWRARIANGTNPIAEFTAKASGVLDYLIAERYADPKRIFVAGTSRGGFMAFHFAAVEERVKAIVAFAPVTDLLLLVEFSGMWNHAGTRSLAAVNLASRLAGRPIWMCIGNNDDRVGTDSAIRFSRAVVEAALAQGKEPDLTFVIQPSKGHLIAPDSHDQATSWLTRRLD